jgi:uncharacterized protein (DUF488 family)
MRAPGGWNDRHGEGTADAEGLALTFYTIGYGGRRPEEFVGLLVEHGVRALADVRIRPDRASMGAYARAKSPDKGIEKLLGDRGIAYHAILELGNPFRDLDDWHPAYRAFFERAGDLLVGRLDDLPRPFCLMCAEKRVAECHRLVIADFLVASRGWAAHHIE